MRKIALAACAFPANPIPSPCRPETQSDPDAKHSKGACVLEYNLDVAEGGYKRAVLVSVVEEAKP